MSRKKYLFKQFLVDPKSNEYSASRLALLVLVCMDVIWALVIIIGWNVIPAHAVQPVSYMLAACTGSVAGIYGASTFGVGRYGMGLGGGIGRPPMPPMGDK